MHNALKRQIRAATVASLAIMPLTTAVADEVSELRKEVQELRKEVQGVKEPKESDSVVHLAGYGSVGYTDNHDADSNSSFSSVQFSPIFHYQYKNLVMLESELEIDTKSDGETETNLEYLTIDLFLTDYMTLVTGKFLSPLGQFRQNLHPSWINRMASAPIGFGHDQAAPVADVGVQLRGGFPMGAMRGNYSLYVANGPELEADNGELEAVEASGVTRDEDGTKAVGGRIGFLPIPSVEIGLSGATGKATVTKNGGVDLTGDPNRTYSAADVDFSYHDGGLRFLAEYIEQKVGDAAASVAPEGGTWKAWYTQVSYQIPETKVEGVLRYGDYDAPGKENDQTQTALGLNWWFAPHVVAKINYEFNDGERGSSADANTFRAQIAYGF